MTIGIHKSPNELPLAESCQAEQDLTTLKQRAALVAGPSAKLLPSEYTHLTQPEMDARIAAAKAKLGTKLIVLGHHYQREDVIRYADFRGDSFMLASEAAKRPEAEFIVFCGVTFMAESADILCAPHQKVLHPNLAAGCSMADMAPEDDVLDCWKDLMSIPQLKDEVIVPITYMNSSAKLKAFCGKNGGAVCTSSNAAGILKWAFERGKRVLFFPDQHLGRNTALKMGVKLDQMPVWDPFQPMGGNDERAYLKSRVVLWKGHCSVHQRFTVDQIRQARERYPGINIIVHPECPMEVVEIADYVGSTEYISKKLREAAPGSKWGVGTETNLVNRLQHEMPDKQIFCLDPVVCPCATMYRIHPAYLVWVLEELVKGNVINQIKVDDETRTYAKVALERMLAIKS